MAQSPWLLPETFFDEISHQHWALFDSALAYPELNFIVSEHSSQIESYFKAGVGRSQADLKKENVRSDKIRWLEKDSPSWKVVEDLRIRLQEELRVRLIDFEAHFSIYNPGGKYDLHVDQFSTGTSSLTPERLFSFILYLNPNWKKEDGGELRIYDENQKLLKSVEPLMGRLIIFRSDLIPHEVTATHSPRYSLTGWMRK